MHETPPKSAESLSHEDGDFLRYTKTISKSNGVPFRFPQLSSQWQGWNRTTWRSTWNTTREVKTIREKFDFLAGFKSFPANDPPSELMIANELHSLVTMGGAAAGPAAARPSPQTASAMCRS